MKSFLEVLVCFLISIPFLLMVALPLKFFEARFCQSWGDEQRVETKYDFWSFDSCKYHNKTSNEWRYFYNYFPDLEKEAQDLKTEKEPTQRELNARFFEEHPEYDINDF